MSDLIDAVASGRIVMLCVAPGAGDLAERTEGGFGTSFSDGR